MPVKSSVNARIVTLFKRQAARKQRNIAAIARTFGLSRTQIYRVLRAEGLIAPAVKRPAKPVKKSKVSRVSKTK